MDNTTKQSPFLKQYSELKAKYPDCILLFRCGDFYETINDDAVKANNILNIPLTEKVIHDKKIQMVGFKFAELDTYLPKLVRAGVRVAITEQLNDDELYRYNKKPFQNRIINKKT